MKILFLVDSLISGGMERRLIELLKGLIAYPDVKPSLVVFSENIHYQEVYDLGIPITILKRIPKKNPMVVYRLFNICKSFKPDLIHSWGTMSAILAIPSTTFLNIKLINGNIVNAPNDMKFYDKELLRAKFTYPFSSVVVGNSHAGLKAYNVPKKKGICIYNGFDQKRILNLQEKEKIRAEFNITTKHVIGMVGSFSERKDFSTFLKAALHVQKQRNDITFISIGDGPNLKDCMEIIPSNLSPYFKFTGIQKDVESIINIFDIGVLCTNAKVHGEGISNAILEYMALKKPVVATEGGGTNEIVEHNKTGILIPPFSTKILAEKLIYLLDNPKVGVEMGIEGNKLLNNKFSLPKMTTAYYKLYKEQLN